MDGYLLGTCRYFCENFEIAKPSALLDGDVVRLNQLFLYFKQF